MVFNGLIIRCLTFRIRQKISGKSNGLLKKMIGEAREYGLIIAYAVKRAAGPCY